MANVQVYLRYHPAHESESEHALRASISSNLSVATTTTQSRRLIRNSSSRVASNGKSVVLLCNAVLDGQTRQQQVYARCLAPLLQQCLSGHNTTVVAMGAPGSGKSYTLGCTSAAQMTDSETAGLLTRAVINLFHQLPLNTTISISACEVWCEEVIDLLAPRDVRQSVVASVRQSLRVSTLGPGPSVASRLGKGPSTAAISQATTAVLASNAEQAIKLLVTACAARQVMRPPGCSPDMPGSSRTHAIFTFSWSKRNVSSSIPSSPSLQRSSTHTTHSSAQQDTVTLTFLDPASSAVSPVPKEAAAVKKSLLAIGKVLAAVATSQHVPFRDSKVTRLLASSLDRVVVLACGGGPLGGDETTYQLIKMLKPGGARSGLMSKQPSMRRPDQVSGADSVRLSANSFKKLMSSSLYDTQSGSARSSPQTSARQHLSSHSTTATTPNTGTISTRNAATTSVASETWTPFAANTKPANPLQSSTASQPANPVPPATPAKDSRSQPVQRGSSSPPSQPAAAVATPGAGGFRSRLPKPPTAATSNYSATKALTTTGMQTGTPKAALVAVDIKPLLSANDSSTFHSLHKSSLELDIQGPAATPAADANRRLRRMYSEPAILKESVAGEVEQGVERGHRHRLLNEQCKKLTSEFQDFRARTLDPYTPTQQHSGYQAPVLRRVSADHICQPLNTSAFLMPPIPESATHTTLSINAHDTPTTSAPLALKAVKGSHTRAASAPHNLPLFRGTQPRISPLRPPARPVSPLLSSLQLRAVRTVSPSPDARPRYACDLEDDHSTPGSSGTPLSQDTDTATNKSLMDNLPDVPSRFSIMTDNAVGPMPERLRVVHRTDSDSSFTSDSLLGPGFATLDSLTKASPSLDLPLSSRQHSGNLTGSALAAARVSPRMVVSPPPARPLGPASPISPAVALTDTDAPRSRLRSGTEAGSSPVSSQPNRTNVSSLPKPPPLSIPSKLSQLPSAPLKSPSSPISQSSSPKSSRSPSTKFSPIGSSHLAPRLSITSPASSTGSLKSPTGSQKSQTLGSKSPSNPLSMSTNSRIPKPTSPTSPCGTAATSATTAAAPRVYGIQASMQRRQAEAMARRSMPRAQPALAAPACAMVSLSSTAVTQSSSAVARSGPNIAVNQVHLSVDVPRTRAVQRRLSLSASTTTGASESSNTEVKATAPGSDSVAATGTEECPAITQSMARPSAAAAQSDHSSSHDADPQVEPSNSSEAVPALRLGHRRVDSHAINISLELCLSQSVTDLPPGSAVAATYSRGSTADGQLSMSQEDGSRVAASSTQLDCQNDGAGGMADSRLAESHTRSSRTASTQQSNTHVCDAQGMDVKTIAAEECTSTSSTGSVDAVERMTAEVHDATVTKGVALASAVEPQVDSNSSAERSASETHSPLGSAPPPAAAKINAVAATAMLNDHATAATGTATHHSTASAAEPATAKAPGTQKPPRHNRSGPASARSSQSGTPPDTLATQLSYNRRFLTRVSGITSSPTPDTVCSSRQSSASSLFGESMLLPLPSALSAFGDSSGPSDLRALGALLPAAGSRPTQPAQDVSQQQSVPLQLPASAFALHEPGSSDTADAAAASQSAIQAPDTQINTHASSSMFRRASLPVCDLLPAGSLPDLLMPGGLPDADSLPDLPDPACLPSRVSAQGEAAAGRLAAARAELQQQQHVHHLPPMGPTVSSVGPQPNAVDAADRRRDSVDMQGTHVCTSQPSAPAASGHSRMALNSSAAAAHTDTPASLLYGSRSLPSASHSSVLHADDAIIDSLRQHSDVGTPDTQITNSTSTFRTAFHSPDRPSPEAHSTAINPAADANALSLIGVHSKLHEHGTCVQGHSAAVIGHGTAADADGMIGGYNGDLTGAQQGIFRTQSVPTPVVVQSTVVLGDAHDGRPGMGAQNTDDTTASVMGIQKTKSGMKQLKHTLMGMLGLKKRADKWTFAS